MSIHYLYFISKGIDFYIILIFSDYVLFCL